MSGPLGSQQWMYATGEQPFYPYTIDNSLRFDGTSYLRRLSATSSAIHQFTMSFWVKISDGGSSSSTPYHLMSFQNYSDSATAGLCLYSDEITYFRQSSAYAAFNPAKARDYSGWYHVVWKNKADYYADIYINGVLIGTTSVQFQTINGSAISVGAGTSGNNPFAGGYIADVHFVSGQSLGPDSFGEYDSTGTIWIPKEYTGSYGTNGFHLDFADGTSATTLGYDAAGSNNFTPSGIATSDQMLDSPTNNFAVLNPLAKYLTNITTSDGNLTATKAAASTNDRIFGSIGVSSGKWYWEANVVALSGAGNYYLLLGIGSGNTTGGVDPDYVVYVGTNDGVIGGNKIINTAGSAVSTAYGANYLAGDIVGVALDCDANTITFYKNGVSQGAITGIQDRLWFPFHFYDGSLNSGTTTYNFGQSAFAYTPPAGFLALNTANLPEPTITPALDDVPADYFNTVLYTGTGAAQSITGVGFQPDWVWIKGRSGATDHGLYDAVRGVQLQLESNTTAAETTETTGLTAFGVDGFTVGALAQLNTSTATYVAWNWKANGAGVSNTDGTITSTVSANQKAGFSIVSYTGTGANATVGHGLGVVPAMVIAKRRDAAAGNWAVHHKDLTDASYYLWLNSTQAQAVGTNIWNSTAPSSSVFSIGTSSNTNTSSGTYIAYCFAEVEGYSKFGSYTGNGSTDGPFVWCGFRPSWLLIKRTDEVTDWHLLDTARSISNVTNLNLSPNTSGAEAVNTAVNTDVLSNGFKMRSSHPSVNNSGSTHIFMAFAEQPFKYSNAR